MAACKSCQALKCSAVPSGLLMGLNTGPEVSCKRLCCYDEQQERQGASLRQARVHGELWGEPATESDPGCELGVYQLHPALC